MKKILKVACIILGSLIGLILLAYLLVYFDMKYRINKQYAFAEEPITIAGDSNAIANGKHLAEIRGCNSCHGADFAGKVVMDDAMLGSIVSRNLTHGKGGLPDDFSARDWVMALRHGVNREGKPLLMMPSQESTLFSQKDINDLIAYGQSLPPVDNQPAESKLKPMIYVLSYLNKFPLLSVEKIDHTKATEQMSVVPGTAEQGHYLSVSCRGCHGESMKGGAPLAPGLPPIPDLTSAGATGRINLHRFAAILRTGINENGKQMDNANMPWQMTSHYTDDEVKALYAYLHSL